nr:peptide chain release factor N(5)-glutamine methyltransferase [Chloroflexia bacterium]
MTFGPPTITTAPDEGSVANALRAGRGRLSLTRTETPGLDAEVLLRHVLGIDRTALFVRLQEPMSPDALASYTQLIDARAADVPVAYLIGMREFMGHAFAVGPDVLIPRPETEILVEWAIEWVRGRAGASVLDVGTGSGSIALSIAAAMSPGWLGRIVGSDVSSEAIAIAAGNRAQLGLDHRVTLVQGSLVSWLTDRVDLLIANLPYLRPDQIAGNPQLAAEPR